MSCAGPGGELNKIQSSTASGGVPEVNRATFNQKLGTLQWELSPGYVLAPGERLAFAFALQNPAGGAKVDDKVTIEASGDKIDLHLVADNTTFSLSPLLQSGCPVCS